MSRRPQGRVVGGSVRERPAASIRSMRASRPSQGEVAGHALGQGRRLDLDQAHAGRAGRHDGEHRRLAHDHLGVETGDVVQERQRGREVGDLDGGAGVEVLGAIGGIGGGHARSATSGRHPCACVIMTGDVANRSAPHPLRGARRAPGNGVRPPPPRHPPAPVGRVGRAGGGHRGRALGGAGPPRRLAAGRPRSRAGRGRRRPGHLRLHLARSARPGRGRAGGGGGGHPSAAARGGRAAGPGRRGPGRSTDPARGGLPRRGGRPATRGAPRGAAGRPARPGRSPTSCWPIRPTAAASTTLGRDGRRQQPHAAATVPIRDRADLPAVAAPGAGCRARWATSPTGCRSPRRRTAAGSPRPPRSSPRSGPRPGPPRPPGAPVGLSAPAGTRADRAPVTGSTRSRRTG